MKDNERTLTRFERNYPVDDQGSEFEIGDLARATSALDGHNDDHARRIGRVVAIGGRGRPPNAITVRFVDGLELGSAAALWRHVRAEEVTAGLVPERLVLRRRKVAA